MARTLPSSLPAFYPEAGYPAFNDNGLSEMLADSYARGSVEEPDIAAVLAKRPVPCTR